MADLEIEPRGADAKQLREILDLLEQIKKQNVVLRRYLYFYGVALALLLLLQYFPVVAQILQIALIVGLVAAVLLTAPFWSKFVVQVTDRIPWFSRTSSRH
jgi:hypothetical protein